jgi:WD40 repeat protein
MSFDFARSDDGQMLVCVGRRLNLFNVASRERISTSRPFPHPSCAAFSPDGGVLTVKHTSGRIVTLDPLTGATLHDHENQEEGEGCEVRFSPDGAELIDASWNGVVTTRKVRDQTITEREEFPGEMITRISHDSKRDQWLFLHKPKVRPGGNWAPYCYLILRKWPFAKHRTKQLSLGCYIESATLSPDATRICLIGSRRSGKKRIQILRASTGKVLARSSAIAVGGTGCELAWSADSKYVGSVQDRRFVFYRASGLAIVGEVPCQYPSSICFLPHGNQLALGSWNSSRFVDVADVLAGKVRMP